MRRKHALLPHDIDSLGPTPPFGLNHFTRQLQRQKRGVSFVQMKDVRRHAELSQQPHTTDAEQHLLHDASLAIAAVKVPGDPAIRLDVLGNVCVKQIKRNTTNIRAPNLGQHVAFTNQNFDPQRRAVSVFHQLNRQLARTGLTVMFFLPTIVTQSLAKVTVTIKETNCDERQPEVTR